MSVGAVVDEVVYVWIVNVSWVGVTYRLRSVYRSVCFSLFSVELCVFHFLDGGLSAPSTSRRVCVVMMIIRRGVFEVYGDVMAKSNCGHPPVHLRYIIDGGIEVILEECSMGICGMDGISVASRRPWAHRICIWT